MHTMSYNIKKIKQNKKTTNHQEIKQDLKFYNNSARMKSVVDKTSLIVL